MRERHDITSNANNGLLERHLDHITNLVVRIKSGRAEPHERSADTLFVIEGHSKLITCGTIINPQGTGEVRGDSVLHGVSTELRAGDIAQIPADTPHQLLLEGSTPWSIFS